MAPPSKRARPVGAEAKTIMALRTAVERLSVAATKPVCRDQQLQMVLAFLNHPNPEPPMLQLFGMPGTGKTAVVRHALTLTENPSSCLTLNGYLLQRPQEVYARLYAHLMQIRCPSEQHAFLQPEQAATSLEWRFRNGWGKAAKAVEQCVLVIDEIDRCCESSGKVLFRLVDWLTLPHARCKLITIANAMDLPGLEPKTRSRMNTTQRVTFESYRAEELIAIVNERLRDVTPKVFADMALATMCKQIASYNGDGRRLLQTAAAVVHNLLCRGETSDLASPKTGLIEVRHVNPLVRKVLQDQFVDYVEAQQSLWTLVMMATIVKEALAQASRGMTTNLPLPLILHLSQHAFAACAQRAQLPAAACALTPFDVKATLVTLQHVRFVELESKDGDTLRDLYLTSPEADDCTVVPLQPMDKARSLLQERTGAFREVLGHFFASK